MTQDIEQDEIKRALATILADDKFAAAPQMSAFLNYVVHQSLAGEADRIKAYTVAVDALGKPPTFDPQNDPSVRVLAKRLRSSLDQYYDRTDGHDVIIELRSGSYRPLFRRAERGAFPSAAPSVLEPTAVASEHDADATTVTSDTASANDIDGRETPTPVAAASAAPESVVEPGDQRHTQEASTDGLGSRSGSSTPSEWYHGLARVPRPVLALVAVGALGYAILDRQQLTTTPISVTDAGALSSPAGDTPTHIALANSVDLQSTRSRPDRPTVFIPRLLPRDGLLARVSNSIGGVMAHFDLVEVVRSRPTSSVGQWPEDYELTMHAINVDNEARVEMQLLHARTGRIAHVERLRFDDADADLTRDEMQLIERTAVSLAESDGPLLRDYRRHAELAPAFACMLSAARTGDIPSDLDGAVDCSEVAINSVGPVISRADALARNAKALPPTERAETLDEARRLANLALEQSPYRAGAHAVLMRLGGLDGNWQAAVDHGLRAIELNPYDDATLRDLAEAMNRTGRALEADQFRERARALAARPEKS